ncbi:flavin reductase family protein [Burkholderia sp. PU8-34]
MDFSVSGLNKAEIYKLMNCMIVPRPIAWVTTMSEDGLVNLAPFSAFSIVCYDPPLLGMNFSRKDDGSRKDSSRNVAQLKELVVHIADDTMLDLVHESSFPHPPKVSEVELLGLAVEPSVGISVPRLRDAPIAIECRLWDIIKFGPSSEYVVAEIIHVHAREGLLSNYKIETTSLRPLSRLAGPVYGTLGPVIVKQPPTGREPE